jgi:uncharacterized protein
LPDLDGLRARLRELDRVVVAFSGGADSAFLAWVAHDELGDGALAVTAVSPSLAPEEEADCRDLAAAWGLDWRAVVTDELADPDYRANDGDRCYHCKATLMDALGPVASSRDAVVVLGVNVDDLGDHRPGQQAAAERGAAFPLVDAGFTKDDVRAASRALGLRTWDKPQLACLSSRFPYGTRITRERLRQVDELEDGLRDLGLRQLRVRYHETIARLEVELDELPRLVAPGVREQVVALGKRLGFTYITVDLAGFRSGSLNETLPGPLVTLGRRTAS